MSICCQLKLVEMLRPEKIKNRRNPKSEGDQPQISESNQLTLPEKVLLLALQNGRTSFWNDNLSVTLRGSILIELSFKGKICLEPKTARGKSLLTRKIIILDDTITGERIIDETLKYIKTVSDEPLNVSVWMECLNGENWNPKYWKFQLKNVKERLAKDLIEKGILSMKKMSFLFFDSFSYPLVDNTVRDGLVKDICENLLGKWVGDPGRMDREILSLILMVYSADILEEVVSTLSDSEYCLMKTRLGEVIERRFEDLAKKNPGNDLFWAVCQHLFK